MNAKRMQTTCVLAGVSLLLVCLAPQADATPAVDLLLSTAVGGQVAAPSDTALSRSDVDQVLRQAQQAIRDGNFDQAEVLVGRAEGAGVHYPLIYFGPTPSSVRRELQRAEKARPTSASKPTSTAATGDRYAVRTASRETEAVDPFVRQQPPLPSSLATQPGQATLASATTASSAPTVKAKWELPDSTMPSIDQQVQLAAPARTSPADDKALALEQLGQARQALNSGNIDLAENLVRATSTLGVPESEFLPGEERPSTLAWEVMQARTSASSAPSAQANNTLNHQITRLPQQGDSAPVAQASISQAAVPAALAPPNTGARQAQLPVPFATLPTGASPLLELDPYAEPNDAVTLLEEGEAALQRRDEQTALECFRQAYQTSDQLDSASRQRLQEHLQMLAGNAARSSATPRVAGTIPTLIDTTDDTQQVLARQLSAEVGKCQSEARRLREIDPQGALVLLREMSAQVQDSSLPEDYRSQLLRRLDITTDDTQKYIEDHRAEIELDARNQAVLREIDRSRETKVKVQQQVAELVDQFNTLRDEQRYAEMEVVARRLIELAPENEVAQQVWQMSKFIRREMMNRDLQDRREDMVWHALDNVEQAAVQNVFDGEELVYDQQKWQDLVKHRKGVGDRNSRRTESELEIERRLKTQILLRYNEMPLSQVVDGLSQLAGVNIYLDPRGLSQEGVHSDTPITINLTKEISLESALNLILTPLHLSYVIKDEVLKVTSEQLRDGELETHTYNVADLVIPIPNFVPSNSIGLQGLINDAHAAMGYGQGIGMPGPTVLLGDNGRGPQRGAAGANNGVLAQQFGAANGAPMSGGSVPIGSGPGGLGGGANADFDSLIDLIVSTVATETWAENGGGEAEVVAFPTNLSLVISQTQAVHEEIADLLEQLRRLQDLQVTIEVRYITLNDSFFERIGVDFNALIQDRTSLDSATLAANGYEGGEQSAIVGLTRGASGLPEFTTDLDIPYTQGLFTLSRPAFGGADPTSFATFGYAILSDIEAYFLVEAAQGDSRTNVLSAPKVTLFNGQQAFVGDFVSQPFVMGVIPVVGEFAAAQQPVIVVLNEGTLMTIQAVVSDDRRYVRLTVVPFFTEIGDVQEFTFQGTTSSTSSNSAAESETSVEESESAEAVHTGVTVQLPSFQQVSVITTVSVPDGGTVLLGGIKRLSEGRSEYGVPLLSKVPYVNRLFRNVGIGRETESLMMMVTPRIIIQEEEEERLGISVP